MQELDRVTLVGGECSHHRDTINSDFVYFQEKTEQTRNASKSIIQNLEAKIVDMENRALQPSAESVEQVERLTTKLQESDHLLRQAQKQVGELEAKKEAWREEVIGTVCTAGIYNYLRPHRKSCAH